MISNRKGPRNESDCIAVLEEKKNRRKKLLKNEEVQHINIAYKHCRKFSAEGTSRRDEGLSTAFLTLPYFIELSSPNYK